MENLVIKWRQDFDYSSGAAEKLEHPVWRDFAIADFHGTSRDHAVCVLNGKIPVVVKEGDVIVSNDMGMRNLYRKRGHKSLKFEDISPSAASLATVGFLS